MAQKKPITFDDLHVLQEWLEEANGAMLVRWTNASLHTQFLNV